MPELRVLHVSDPHFSEAHHYFKQSEGEAAESLLLTAILDGSQPDLLCVTGDIVWSGIEEEYVIAQRFFRLVRSRAPRVPVLTIPGNHDVDLRDSVPDVDRQKSFLRFLRKLYSRRALEAVFPLLGDPRFEHLSPRERLVALMVNDHYVVVGVNTAAYLRAHGEPASQLPAS